MGLWERQLLDHFYTAAVEFVKRYTHEDGTLIWRDDWPGMDGGEVKGPKRMPWSSLRYLFRE